MSGLAIGYSSYSVHADLVPSFDPSYWSLGQRGAYDVTLTPQSPPYSTAVLNGPPHNTAMGFDGGYIYANNSISDIGLIFSYVLEQLGSSSGDATFSFAVIDPNIGNINMYQADAVTKVHGQVDNVVTVGGDNQNGAVSVNIPAGDTFLLEFMGTGTQSGVKPGASLNLSMGVSVVPEAGTWLSGVLLVGAATFSAVRQKKCKRG